MFSQATYSRDRELDFEWPCLRLSFDICSIFEHPHDLIKPLRSSYPGDIVVLPHEHRHNQ